MSNLINQAYKNTPNNSLLHNKIYFLETFCQKVLDEKINGSVAEAGVYKGGSARLLATAFPYKNIHLFDSFEGMLEDDELIDGHHKTGDFSDVSLNFVKHYLKDCSNCFFHKGWLPESANFLTDEKFCFVHLDMDYYQSTKHGLEIFWPRLEKNGVMILDDWEWHHCPGVKKAADEFFSNNKDYEKIVEQSKGSCAFIKK